MVKLSELLLYGIPGLLVVLFIGAVPREFFKDPGAGLREIWTGLLVVAF